MRPRIPPPSNLNRNTGALTLSLFPLDPQSSLDESRTELESIKTLLRDTRDQLDMANKTLTRKEDAERRHDDMAAKYDEIRRELRAEKAEP